MSEIAGLQGLRDRVTLLEAGLSSSKEENEMLLTAIGDRLVKMEQGLDEFRQDLGKRDRKLYERINTDQKESRDANTSILDKLQKAIDGLTKGRSDDTRRQLAWIKGIAGSVIAAIITGALIAFLK